ncbi:MAG: Peptidase family protein [Bacteroidota bacterium]|nr:Peptidase family protein [Bacteroidota bacterium]
MIKKSLFIALAVFTFQFTKANTVNEATAKTIAINFFKANVPQGHAAFTATLGFTQTEDGIVDFYIYNISPKGFVIVAADDNIIPVLAYSTESDFAPGFEQTGVADWVLSASANIHYTIVNHITANPIVPQLWQSYLNGQNPNTNKSAVIGPLLKTTWNQAPYYNSLCPVDASTSTRAVTGCVATTMAQIMKYWSYPPQGTGSYSYNDSPPQYTNSYGTQSANFGAKSYNWAAMPNAVSSNTSPVDTLMYHCGVAVAMDYGTDAQGGSGAFVLQSETGNGNPCAQYAFANYFKYNPNTMQGVRQSSYSAADWLNLMKNELNNGRVIEYEGADPTYGGHTWVCDGYDNNNLLHMNWGWGGASNGYFAPGNLNAGGYNFSQNDAALIGIQPIYPFTASISSTNTTLCSGGTATLIANGPVGATYTWTPNTLLNCDTCAVTDAAVNSTTLYTVTIDSAGVKVQLSLAIVIAQPVSANFVAQTATTCTLPQKVSFANTSSNGTSYLWDFGDGTTDTSSSPVHQFNTYGNFNVMLSASNDCFADTIVELQAANIIDKAPFSADQNICSGQTVTINSTDNFGTMNWYDAPNGGTLLTTGGSYTTPALNSTTVYYIDATITQAATQAGPLDSTIGMGNYYTRTTQRGMIFNSTAPQTLVSVDIFSDSAGSRTITLMDSSGATINSTTVSLTKGKQTVPLNFILPVGNRMKLVTGGFSFLFRSTTGASYPYISNDGNLVITGNTSNSATGYYYFYNWQIQPSVCVTARTAVPVFVLNTGGGSFAASGNYNQVNFLPADTNATSYSWNFGDGNTSTEMAPAHSYTADGNYTVQLVISNGTCADTINRTINTATLGVNDVSSLQSLSIYPNPAKDILILSVSQSRSIDNCLVTITNMVGQQITKQIIDLNAGANTFHYSIADLSAGVYLLSLQSGTEVVTRRFVKE